MCQNLYLRFIPFIDFCQVFFSAPFFFFDLTFYYLFFFFDLVFLSPFVFSFFALVFFSRVVSSLAYLNLLGNKMFDCYCCCKQIRYPVIIRPTSTLHLQEIFSLRIGSRNLIAVNFILVCNRGIQQHQIIHLLNLNTASFGVKVNSTSNIVTSCLELEFIIIQGLVV
jgi:hypothetical protein